MVLPIFSTFVVGIVGYESDVLCLFVYITNRENSRDDMHNNNSSSHGHSDVRNGPAATNDGGTSNTTKPPGLDNIAKLTHTSESEPNTAMRATDTAQSPTNTLKPPTNTLRSPTNTLRSPTNTINTTDQIASEVKAFDFR